MSATGIRAGRAFVEIGVADKYTTALNAAQAKLRNFAAGAQAVGKQMAATGLAMAAPLAASVFQFARFDDAMRSVGAVTRASQADLQSMTDTAAELGRTTSFTSVEVANLMTELGRAGFSPRQINEMTAAVLNLSRATGTDASLSAGILASTLRQFKLEAKDAARVADVLTLAANATFNTVEGLGESLKYAGPVAARLGMSLESTVAILGALGNVGVQGSEAGTALRRLSVLAAATGDDLKRIFGVSNVDSSGKFKDLIVIMDEIGKSIAHLPVTVQVEKMNEAFGLLGITASSVLSGAALEVVALEQQLKEAAGTAAKAAEQMDAGIGGSFRRFVSALEGVGNAVGKALEGPVSDAASVFGTLLGELTAWVAANKTAVTSIAVLSASLIAFGSALIGVALSVKVVAFGIGGLTVAVKAAVIGINALRLTMLALGVTAAATSGGIAGLRAAATGLAAMKAISPAAAGGMRGLLKLFSTGLPAAKVAIMGLGGAFTTALVPLLPFIAKALLVVAAIGAVAAVVVLAAKRAAIFAGAWNAAKKVIAELLGVVEKTFGGVMAALKAGQYVAAAEILWSGIKAAFWAGVNSATQAIAGLFDNWQQKALDFASSFATILTDLFTSIPSLIMSAIRGGQSLASLMAEVIMGGPSGVGQMAEGSAKELDQRVADAKAAADEAAKQKRKNDELKRLDDERKELEEARAKTEASYAAARQSLGPNASHDDIDRYAEASTALGPDAGEDAIQSYMEKLARLNEVKGVVSDEQEQAETAKALKDRIAALKQETLVLEKGEEAVERLRFSQAGLTEELQAYDEALATKAEAEMRKAINERIAALQDEILVLNKGEDAAERYRLSLKGATDAQLKALKAAQEAAEQARKAEELKSVGQALKESLRNPLEVFGAKLAEVRQLEAAGAIDDETGLRARDKAREDFMGGADSREKREQIWAAEQRRLRELVDAGKLNPEAAQRAMSAVGALLEEAKNRAAGAGDQLTKLTSQGTFSGFAAGRLSGGTKSEQLQSRIADAAEQQIEEQKETRRAIEQLGQTYQ